MYGPMSTMAAQNPPMDMMDRMVARRFAPLNFSDIPGFPNPVPTMDIWGDCLPWFREYK